MQLNTKTNAGADGPGPVRVLIVGLGGTIPAAERRLVESGRPIRVVARLDLEADPDRRGEALGRRIDAMVAEATPDLAIISLPAVAADLLSGIRTAFRRCDVPERFFPTSADLLDGVGPRTLPEIEPASLLDRASRPIDQARIGRLFEGRRVIVTGAGGSIGSELSRRIADYAPAELVLMDRSEHALFEIDRQLARSHPELRRRASLQDVADAAGTLRVFESIRPNIVLHAAAHKHVPLSEDHPREAVRNNLVGSLNAVRASIAVGANRFVLVSTDKAVAPSSVMGGTKRLAEAAVQRAAADAGMGCAVVRFGNVLGSSGSVLDIWAREIRDGGPITVTDRRMTRYLMTIPEAAGLVLQAATFASPDGPAGRVHVLDMGEPVRIVDLARRFVAAHGLRVVDRASSERSAAGGEVEIVYTSARPGEKLHEILARPGRRLGSTDHPAIQTWDGIVPPMAVVASLVADADRPAGTSREKAAEAVRRAVTRLDELAGVGELGEPSVETIPAVEGHSASIRSAG